MSRLPSIDWPVISVMAFLFGTVAPTLIVVFPKHPLAAVGSMGGAESWLGPRVFPGWIVLVMIVAAVGTYCLVYLFILGLCLRQVWIASDTKEVEVIRRARPFRVSRSRMGSAQTLELLLHRNPHAEAFATPDETEDWLALKTCAGYVPVVRVAYTKCSRWQQLRVERLVAYWQEVIGLNR